MVVKVIVVDFSGPNGYTLTHEATAQRIASVCRLGLLDDLLMPDSIILQGAVLMNKIRTVRQLACIEGKWYVREPEERFVEDRMSDGRRYMRSLGFKPKGKGATIEEALRDFCLEMLAQGKNPADFQVMPFEEGKLIEKNGVTYWVPMDWYDPDAKLLPINLA